HQLDMESFGYGHSGDRFFRRVRLVRRLVLAVGDNFLRNARQWTCQREKRKEKYRGASHPLEQCRHLEESFASAAVHATHWGEPGPHHPSQDILTAPASGSPAQTQASMRGCPSWHFSRWASLRSFAMVRLCHFG